MLEHSKSRSSPASNPPQVRASVPSLRVSQDPLTAPSGFIIGQKNARSIKQPALALPVEVEEITNKIEQAKAKPHAGVEATSIPSVTEPDQFIASSIADEQELQITTPPLSPALLPASFWSPFKAVVNFADSPPVDGSSSLPDYDNLYTQIYNHLPAFREWVKKHEDSQHSPSTSTFSQPSPDPITTTLIIPAGSSDGRSQPETLAARSFPSPPESYQADQTLKRGLMDREVESDNHESGFTASRHHPASTTHNAAKRHCALRQANELAEELRILDRVRERVEANRWRMLRIAHGDMWEWQYDDIC
ncbi:hypothetical protein H0H93_000839 [Arthromyces matolae]|nr:hypothetical protein H0H93_000839 [Arthromyces matolae]